MMPHVPFKRKHPNKEEKQHFSSLGIIIKLAVGNDKLNTRFGQIQ